MKSIWPPQLRGTAVVPGALRFTFTVHSLACCADTEPESVTSEIMRELPSGDQLRSAMVRLGMVTTCQVAPGASGECNCGGDIAGRFTIISGPVVTSSHD